jgi:hypothetical protein
VAPLPPAFPGPAAQPTAPLLLSPPAVAQQPVRRRDARVEEDKTTEDAKTSEEWMVAVEAFTRVPLDMGIQAGVEFPFGLRLSTGYGWVPTPYRDFLTQSLADSAGAGNNTATVLREGLQSGRTLRLQAGIRPFRDLGLYFDAGFTNLSLEGSIDGSTLRGVTPGDYNASTSIDAWLLEIGYQTWVGQHFTLAGGLGLSGVMSSHTELSGAGLDPDLAKRIAQSADEEIEKWGVLPTLTLRLGFDMI